MGFISALSINYSLLLQKRKKNPKARGTPTGTPLPGLCSRFPPGAAPAPVPTVWSLVPHALLCMAPPHCAAPQLCTGSQHFTAHPPTLTPPPSQGPQPFRSPPLQPPNTAHPPPCSARPPHITQLPHIAAPHRTAPRHRTAPPLLCTAPHIASPHTAQPPHITAAPTPHSPPIPHPLTLHSPPITPLIARSPLPSHAPQHFALRLAGPPTTAAPLSPAAPPSPRGPSRTCARRCPRPVPRSPLFDPARSGPGRSGVCAGGPRNRPRRACPPPRGGALKPPAAPANQRLVYTA